MDDAYFATPGVTATIGRPIQTGDDLARVVVLSDGLWRTRFAADPKILAITEEDNILRRFGQTLVALIALGASRWRRGLIRCLPDPARAAAR